MTGLGRCVVTGGGGYLGRALCTALAHRGEEVVALDARPVDLGGMGVRSEVVDIRDRVALTDAMAGADTVFHTASLIDLATWCDGSRRARSYDINVGGTRNVIDACRAAGAQRLVYTSSNTVVFDGRPATRVTEDAPYPSRPVGLYTATKALAERAVLQADGPGLHTCAIRPSGIWGPGEQHHLPRVIDEALRGRFIARFGAGDAISEWSYIDNVVHGHLLAADRLGDGSPACGQAYFINDGWYADTIEFFRPLLEGSGLRFPTVAVPASPAVGAVRAWEWLHRRLGLPAPLVTKLELLQMVVSHPCSIDKARDELGYRPVVTVEEAVHRTLPYCWELVEERRPRRRQRAPSRQAAS